MGYLQMFVIYEWTPILRTPSAERSGNSDFKVQLRTLLDKTVLGQELLNVCTICVYQVKVTSWSALLFCMDVFVNIPMPFSPRCCS